MLFFEGFGEEFGFFEFGEGAGPPFTGEEGGARDDAHAAVLKAGESGAVCGKAVESRGGDFSAEAGGVGVAHVIGKDDDEIGLFTSGPRGQKEENNEVPDHESVLQS